MMDNDAREPSQMVAINVETAKPTLFLTCHGVAFTSWVHNHKPFLNIHLTCSFNNITLESGDHYLHRTIFANVLQKLAFYSKANVAIFYCLAVGNLSQNRQLFL
jgi:hypothetical protein